MSAVCRDACADGWHAVGCPNGVQFTLGMGAAEMLRSYAETERLAARGEVLETYAAPQLGPRTIEDELADERERFIVLERTFNELFRRQWDAAQSLKSCGARIQKLERILTPDPIPGYNAEGGAR